MILRGKPIPDELKPLERSLYLSMIDQVYPPQTITALHEYLNKFLADWQVMTAQSKLQVLDKSQDILFSEFIPKPTCQLTFSRVRFSASFHSNDWSIRFSENYFHNPFHRIFKTWLHESYHAFLHFLSLRLGTPKGVKVIQPPQQISQIASQHPIPANQPAAKILAERNLLGMLDRYLTYTDRSWAGLDSYYLNVEIIVETLTELTFQKLFPGVRYRRSYRTAEEYIHLRQSGYPPIKACSY